MKNTTTATIYCWPDGNAIQVAPRLPLTDGHIAAYGAGRAAVVIQPGHTATLMLGEDQDLLVTEVR